MSPNHLLWGKDADVGEERESEDGTMLVVVLNGLTGAYFLRTLALSRKTVKFICTYIIW